MINNSIRLTLQKFLVYAQIQELIVVLAASVILPILIHTIPSYGSIVIGARLLPMFYAPFISISYANPHVALIASFLAPSLNALITGLPVPGLRTLLTLQLVIFTSLSYLSLKKWPAFWGASLISYLTAVFSSSLSLYFIPLVQKEPLAYFVNTLVQGLPGIFILLLINIGVVKLKKDKFNDRIESPHHH